MDESPDSPSSTALSESRNVEIPVYSVGKLGIGTYIGGPLVATFMLARNFAALGHRERAKQAWLIGGLGSLAIFALVMMIPESIMQHVPNMVIPLAYTGAAAALFKSHQDAEITAHLAADGKPASGWRVAIISLLGLLLTVAIIIPLALAAPTMEGERITVGALEHEVFYEPPVTEAQARSVGAALNEAFFSQLDFATYVKVERSGGGYTVFFPVQDGAWDDPLVVSDYLSMRPALSAALGGADVSIVLFFEGLRERQDHPI